MVFSYLKRAQLQTLVLFGKYDKALPLVRERTQSLAGNPECVFRIDYNFFAGLTITALYQQLEPAAQAEYMIELDDCLRHLAGFAQIYPANFAHSYAILQAEKARMEGRIADAMRLYQQGIDSAQKNSFWEHEAIGSELAGQFYAQQGFDEFAEIYFRQAHYAYQQWGATAKVKQLEEKYPELIQSMRPVAGSGTIMPTMTATQSTSRTTRSQILDMNSVVKASQAISSEINLNSLLEKMIKIVVENAGAQRGLLILKQANEWRIEAKLETDPFSTTILSGTPIESVGGRSEQPELSGSITQYVIRTRKPLVLNDARQDERFGQGSYIQKRQPKSVLCMPLLNQGQVSGVLYLENNLTPGAFTPERLELLQLLSAQMAISLENAKLYNNLEGRVEERTRELRQTLENLQRTQAQLVESEKMASLGSMVAGVAHEINTPVGIGITAASGLVEKTKSLVTAYKAGDLKQTALKSYLNTAMESGQLILENLQWAAELVQSFKQTAVDQTSLEQRTFLVKDYLEDTMRNLHPKLKHTQHVITIEGDKDLTLDSYPGALSQVVTNLVLNSITHAYKEGEVGQLRFEFKPTDKRLVLTYADDGAGIPPENLKRIFEPFFTTARAKGGTGLGLHIVYNLVTQKLKGTIHCESAVGQGTKFVIDLPLQA